MDGNIIDIQLLQKNEVIAYLSEIAQWYSSKLNKTIKELNEAKGTH